ncbi:MAG: Crp/Fnr family transcriptional regulator [Planctomycetaceae bacterium]|nr:MAG: Crp/Fnr family transcriptional regulator [Planctomycetaceae bacterium]
MSERLWYLKRCELFERLTSQQLAALESHCSMRKFPKRSLVYSPRDPTEGVFLMAAGRVKICTLTDDGKQAILAFLEPGELFGELAVLGPDVHEDYAEACEDSLVIRIPVQVMQRMIDEHPEFGTGITKLIGLRRRRLERRLRSLLFRSNRDRLILALLDLAEQYGYPTASGIQLGVKLSHQDLANMIGSTRESVTIALGELQAERYLRVGRRKIVLVNLERLARTVNAAVPIPGSRYATAAVENR